MRTIEESARAFAKHESIIDHRFTNEGDRRTAEHACYKAALRMAELTQKWYSTDEELPKNEKVVLLKINIKGVSFIDIGYYDITDKLFYSTSEITVKYPTHWKPINYE